MCLIIVIHDKQMASALAHTKALGQVLQLQAGPGSEVGKDRVEQPLVRPAGQIVKPALTDKRRLAIVAGKNGLRAWTRLGKLAPETKRALPRDRYGAVFAQRFNP